jgi:tRNA threonylcarbamoyladenosine biosynthesis protein TsaB
MNLVAFETSSESISVAVAKGDLIASRDYANAGQQSGELTLPAMHQLLRELGLAVRDLDVVVFGQGPGSFTGVRIACGVAQGLAYGLGKPVIALHSPLAVAQAAARHGATHVLVANDARMGEIYLAAYVLNPNAPSGFDEIVAPCLLKPEMLDDVVAPSMEGVAWSGVGTAFDVPDLAQPLMSDHRVTITPLPNIRFPSAADLILVAQKLIRTLGDAAMIRPHDAAPLYVRNKVAMTIEERRQLAAAKAAVAA